MEKEKLYHIALDDYEHGVVIRSLKDVYKRQLLLILQAKRWRYLLEKKPRLIWTI